jgi:hypothetical protein
LARALTEPTVELGSSPMLDNLLALKAELLRREAELAGQYGERHPKLLDARAEKAKLEYRIREERQVLRKRCLKPTLRGSWRGRGCGNPSRGGSCSYAYS